jgi:hypothetical protein
LGRIESYVPPCICISHVVFCSSLFSPDHDYGCDNGDKTYPHKYESANAFVNFIGESEDSPMSRRAQAGYGVYGVKLFDFDRIQGHELVPDEEARIDADVLDHHLPYSNNNSPGGHYSNKTVAVFVLDIRSNKDPWQEGAKAFQPDYEGDFLGEHQWKWLETSIKRSRAQVNVIVNGLQVHSNLFPSAHVAEKWANFPRSQQRLFDAILQDNVQAPILVSGDVHMTQFMRKDCQNIKQLDGSSPRRTARPLIEMTTSGMTHSWGTMESPLLHEPDYQPSLHEYFGSLVRRTTMTMMHYVNPWTDLLVSTSISADDAASLESDQEGRGLFESGGAEGAKQGLQYSLERNFGELEFDWEKRTIIMRTMGEDPKAPPLLSLKADMDQVTGIREMPGSTLLAQDFLTLAAKQQPPSLDDTGDQWVCINHRGRVSTTGEVVGHLGVGVGLVAVALIPLMFPVLAALLCFRRRHNTHSRTSQKLVSPPAAEVASSYSSKYYQFPGY